jgi:hypothetical protein
VREAERQAALREGVGGGHETPDHGVTAFAVQQFSRFQFLFRNRHRIRTPAGRAARGLAAQADGGDRDADFQPDQVPALVQAGIASRRIGLHAVLHEAAADVFGVALEHNEDAEADVVPDLLSIRGEG